MRLCLADTGENDAGEPLVLGSVDRGVPTGEAGGRVEAAATRTSAEGLRRPVIDFPACGWGDLSPGEAASWAGRLPELESVFGELGKGAPTT